jgi:hypothetical protein
MKARFKFILLLSDLSSRKEERKATSLKPSAPQIEISYSGYTSRRRLGGLSSKHKERKGTKMQCIGSPPLLRAI